MKQNNRLSMLIVLVFFANSFIGHSQIKKERLKLGFAYGTGSQNKPPFDLVDYTHEVTFYKALINYRFKQKRKWAFEMSLEPSFNVAEHQLLNEHFIKPKDDENYEALRELYTQKRTFNEYVLNCGLVARYFIYKNISTYVIGSLGVMTADKATERLAKGFAFSDVAGLGLSYEINKIQLDFRYSVRHTSNLELQQPNKGHNTTNMEFGLLFRL